MALPPRGHPIWGLTALGVICVTLCVCLQVFYSNGFVLDKDGWTVGITATSGLLMFVLRQIFGSKE